MACNSQMMGQTDRWTDARQFHRTCSAYYASCVNNDTYFITLGILTTWGEKSDMLIMYAFLSCYNTFSALTSLLVLHQEIIQTAKKFEFSNAGVVIKMLCT